MRLPLAATQKLCVVQSLTRVRLSATPRTAARQASLSISDSRSLLKPMPIESVMPPSRLILCRPLLLPPSIFPSIRGFSKVPGAAGFKKKKNCPQEVSHAWWLKKKIQNWAEVHRAGTFQAAPLAQTLKETSHQKKCHHR